MSKHKSGIQSKKQPYAYAKQGGDGKWYHWRVLAGKLAQGLVLGSGFVLAKWLFGDGFSLLGSLSMHGLTGDIVKEVKGWFS